MALGCESLSRRPAEEKDLGRTLGWPSAPAKSSRAPSSSRVVRPVPAGPAGTEPSSTPTQAEALVGGGGATGGGRKELWACRASTSLAPAPSAGEACSPIL